MFRKFVLIAAALLAVAMPASAQDSPVSINLGGGFTIRCSDLKDSFGVGGNLPSGIISSIPLSANHSMHDADFNLLLGPALKDKAAVPYAIVGAGVYHQIVNVTTPSVGLATVCDPWIYVCYPVAVPVTQIIGERSNTAFGWNLGGGVTARVNETTKFYAEIRYIHTNGPTFTDPAGVSRTANGNYFPFTFGFRFHSAD
jgi:opacity protein-like surface antigen